ncbi:hypothetical protein LIA77_00059 [Sarocladium implicatum]|nr:hypothetical protein LIA77_00059 [Sarocladium implicatum]
MSQKITSKNLSYSTNLPPFLAALHAEAGNATGPDPLLARQRRGVKKRSASEEAEDVPLVVDDEGNAVEVEVEKDGTVKSKDQPDSEGRADEIEETGSTDQTSRKEEAKSGFGARKRKAGRVIGDESGQEEEEKKDARANSNAKQHEGKSETQVKEKKPKKKGKKIKLSFDEEA